MPTTFIDVGPAGEDGTVPLVYVHKDILEKPLEKFGRRVAPKVSHIRLDEGTQEWFAVLQDGREIARHKERAVVVEEEARIISEMWGRGESIPGGVRFYEYDNLLRKLVDLNPAKLIMLNAGHPLPPYTLKERIWLADLVVQKTELDGIYKVFKYKYGGVPGLATSYQLIRYIQDEVRFTPITPQQLLVQGASAAIEHQTSCLKSAHLPPPQTSPRLSSGNILSWLYNLVGRGLARLRSLVSI